MLNLHHLVVILLMSFVISLGASIGNVGAAPKLEFEKTGYSWAPPGKDVVVEPGHDEVQKVANPERFSLQRPKYHVAI